MEIVYPKQNSQSSIRCFDKRTTLFSLSRCLRTGQASRVAIRAIGQKPEPAISIGTAHKSLPPGGRWHAERDGRSPRNLQFMQIFCHALSLSLLLRKIQLPPGGSLLEAFTDKETPPRNKSLVVFVLSTLQLHSRWECILLLIIFS